MNSALQNLFDQASEAQAQGKTEEALALYDSIKVQGYTSYAVELNQALLFESKEEYGRALKNIDVAQAITRRPWLGSEIQERIQKKVPGNRAYSIGSLGELMNEGNKVVRSDESFFIGAVLLGFFLLSRAIGFKARINTIVISLASIFILFGIFSIFSYKPTYLITDGELRTVPLASSPTKLTLPNGTKATILRESKDFIEIERPGDFVGWIEKNSL